MSTRGVCPTGGTPLSLSHRRRVWRRRRTAPAPTSAAPSAGGRTRGNRGVAGVIAPLRWRGAPTAACEVGPKGGRSARPVLRSIWGTRALLATATRRAAPGGVPSATSPTYYTWDNIASRLH
jgi:hypothetical protein